MAHIGTSHWHGTHNLHLETHPLFGHRGANTGIGKTLVSIGLADAARRLRVPLLYIKPVQTGFPDDSDARLVASAYGTRQELGPHAAMLLPPSENANSCQSAVSRVTVAHAWSSPVSPHLAVSREGRSVSDREILALVSSELSDFAQRLERSGTTAAGRDCHVPMKGLALLETAGGVASPAPSGELQVNLGIRLHELILSHFYSGNVAPIFYPQ